MNELKTITRSEYLQALGLYTMACRLQQDCDQFNAELNKMLGLESDSRISDGIYARPPEAFDLVLGYAKISVEAELPPPRVPV